MSEESYRMTIKIFLVHHLKEIINFSLQNTKNKETIYILNVLNFFRFRDL